MPLDVEDEQVFKAYVIKKLDAISDADSEVLADYVVALIKTDDAAAVSSALEDFIPDSAQNFVDEVFSAIANKTYDPKAASKSTTNRLVPAARVKSTSNKQPATSRKRSYHDWDATQTHNGHISATETTTHPAKRNQRGGRPSRLARANAPPQSYDSFRQMSSSMQLPPLPTPPPGMPPFDMNNPIASFTAMQQAMGMLLGMPDAGTFETASAVTHPDRRCRDYDTKGFCMRGTSCPYEHADPILVPGYNDEYNPEEPLMLENVSMQTDDARRIDNSSSKYQRNEKFDRRAHNKRASFSMAGPNRPNTWITSLVVEQIPKEYLNEPAVRGFFSQFGQIDSIDLHYHRALAIVNYDEHGSAKAAYQSPKCIFENRFVKVFWYKPEKMSLGANDHASATLGDGVSMASEEPAIDIEEVARLQEEAQKRYDAAKIRRLEVLEQRRMLDEKLAKVNWERQRAVELLARKSRASVPGDDDDEQTTLLKARLAELQSEAKNLGIDMDGEPSSNGHVRGGFAGQSRRGRGSTTNYGSRGGARSVMSLDNRPRVVAITFVDSRYQDHEEAMRQYLMFNGLDSASLTPHPTNGDTALIRFQQRYEGENFLAAASYAGPLAHSDLPRVIGKVKLEWYKPEQKRDEQELNSEDEAGGGADISEEAHNGISVDSKTDAPRREDRDMDTYDEGDEVY